MNGQVCSKVGLALSAPKPILGGGAAANSGYPWKNPSLLSSFTDNLSFYQLVIHGLYLLLSTSHENKQIVGSKRRSCYGSLLCQITA